MNDCIILDVVWMPENVEEIHDFQSELDSLVGRENIGSGQFVGSRERDVSWRFELPELNEAVEAAKRVERTGLKVELIVSFERSQIHAALQKAAT